MSEQKPVAYQYRWKLDGEWTKWHVADHSQKSSYLVKDIEERELYLAPPPPADDVVERVERAICDAMNADPKGGSFSRAARAAIEVIQAQEQPK